MTASVGLVGWGQLRCSARFTAQLLILRLMTCGLERRRSGSGWARISVIAYSCASLIVWGGKSRLGAGGSAGSAEASDER